MIYGRYNTGVASARDGRRARRSVTIEPGPVTDGGLVTLVHDICKGAHPAFRGASCIYSEIAWRAGYSTFTKGSEAEGSTHGDYLAGLLSCIYELRIPALIVCGKREARQLRPQGQRGITFVYHHAPAVLASWFTEVPDSVITDVSACRWLIETYGTVLDPCCGFGNTARRAEELGRGAIMADVDPECVKYVRDGGHRDGARPPHPPHSQESW